MDIEQRTPLLGGFGAGSDGDSRYGTETQGRSGTGALVAREGRVASPMRNRAGSDQIDSDGDNEADAADPRFLLNDEFGGDRRHYANRVVRTGRVRKKQAARSKGGEFQSRRRKKRVYFCCISSEIDVQGLCESLASVDSPLTGWKYRMYNEVLHIYKQSKFDSGLLLDRANRSGRDNARQHISSSNIRGYASAGEGENMPGVSREGDEGAESGTEQDYNDVESGYPHESTTLMISQPLLHTQSMDSKTFRNGISAYSSYQSGHNEYDPMPTQHVSDDEQKLVFAQTRGFYEKDGGAKPGNSPSAAVDVDANLATSAGADDVVGDVKQKDKSGGGGSGRSSSNGNNASGSSSFNISAVGAQEVFVFDFGAVVFWGFIPGEEKRLLEIIRSHCTKGLVGVTEFESGEDDMAFVTSSDTSRITLANDMIILPEESVPKHRLAVSFAIAQSSVLSVFEDRIEQLVEAYKYIPETLARQGRIHLDDKQLGMMIGDVFVIRHDVNLHTEILDTPDFFWKEDAYETEYQLVMLYLEMSSRTEILNKRLDMLREMLDVLQQQMETAHAVILEWIIIWLIIAEVVLEVMAILFHQKI